MSNTNLRNRAHQLQNMCNYFFNQKSVADLCKVFIDIIILNNSNLSSAISLCPLRHVNELSISLIFCSLLAEITQN